MPIKYPIKTYQAALIIELLEKWNLMLDMQTVIEFQRKDRNVKKDLLLVPGCPSLALLWAFKISWLTDSW